MASQLDRQRGLALKALSISQAIQQIADEQLSPPIEGLPPRTNLVVMKSLTRHTRGYIEKTVDQINGCYENGWYDACAVMIRRLLETLIIEAFEQQKAGHLIQESSGHYKQLGELVDEALNYTGWKLQRDTEKCLRQLKNVGDMSAHARRFIAHRGDIEKWIPGLRVTVQEFVYLAGLK